MKITLLTDNKNSWIIPYVNKLIIKLSKAHDVKHVFNIKDILPSDILFILSCEKIVKKQYLDMNINNIVIHPSRLPEGRGWSPVAWQVLEGKNWIPISLFEAKEKVDSGNIYILDYIELKGTELNEEIKHLQGIKTIEMAERYVKEYPMTGPEQDESLSTYYKKRNSESSMLDINKTIKENFNLLRVVDNERYPAFFFHNNKKYIIKIYEEQDV
jgi:methionyl-tRNA formyltransferase